jgi:cytidine deaminase
MIKSNTQFDELLRLARQSATKAYAPFSNFTVGAALLASDGQIFLGCNVENSSYGLTICAERTAAVSAIAAGNRSWQAIAIVSPTSVPPCGACLQVLVEFSKSLEVCIGSLDADKPTRVFRITDLLPVSMHLDVESK